MSFITRDWSIQNVLPRIFDTTDLLISDVTKKRRLVEQGQDKGRVSYVEFAQ